MLRRRPFRCSQPLPFGVEAGLVSLEVQHAIRAGGRKVKAGMLPDKARQFFAGLEAAGVDWVLVGAAAINHYLRRPRATLDVDVVVREKDLRKAKRVLKAACPDLRETESSPLGPPEGTVVNLHGTLSPDPMRLEADVIKSQSHELFGVALDRKVVAGGVKLATVEVLLALKYLAAVSSWRRREDKMQDVVDFARTFKDNRDRIDRALLLDLALRAHEGAREDFPRFLDSVENDKPITI